MTRTRLYCQFRFRFFLGESRERHCWFSHYDGNYQVQTREQNCYPQAFSNVTMILTEMSQIRLMLVTVKWCHVTCHTLCHDVTCNMWRSESWDDGIIGMCWLPLYLLFWAPHAIIVQSRRVSRDNEAMRRHACVHPVTVTIIGRCVTRDRHAHTSHYMSRE